MLFRKLNLRVILIKFRYRNVKIGTEFNSTIFCFSVMKHVE